MAQSVKPIPAGYHSLTPHLTVRNAAQAVEFYKKAFGAKNEQICYAPDGEHVMHAEIQIGDSKLMLNDESPEWGCLSPLSKPGAGFLVNIYVDDVDAVFNRAVEAGATPVMPVADQFWGDRYGQLTDPFGHRWSIATHKEDVSPDEIKRRAEAFFAGGGCEKAGAK
ncbi:MAG: VOC family protein [Phycisphaerales bacterium]|nr:MAG: VOC family protein [Phycisphaerales bacterium]